MVLQFLNCPNREHMRLSRDMIAVYTLWGRPRGKEPVFNPHKQDYTFLSGDATSIFSN